MADDYATHYPVMAAAIARTRGPVLELGCGEGSTPLIHYAAHGRFIMTAETDLEWMKRFDGYRIPNQHEFEHVVLWENFTYIESLVHIGCALVDCAPGEERHKLAIRLARKAQFVILHDSEKDYNVGTNYMYEQAVPHYRFVTEFRRFRPYTMICSNFEPFRIEECDKVWTPPKT